MRNPDCAHYINPRRACAARVMFVCVSVCLLSHRCHVLTANEGQKNCGFSLKLLRSRDQALAPSMAVRIGGHFFCGSMHAHALSNKACQLPVRACEFDVGMTWIRAHGTLPRVCTLVSFIYCFEVTVIETTLL